MTAHQPLPWTADPFSPLNSLVPGEDQEAYQELRTRVFATVAPEDALESIWTGNLVDLEWERQRLVRVRTHVLIQGREWALIQLVRQGEPPASRAYRNAPTLVRRFLAGDIATHAYIEQLLLAKGYDLLSVISQCCISSLSVLDQLERQIAGKERRRDKLLREVEARRKALAPRLREAAAREAENNRRLVEERLGRA